MGEVIQGDFPRKLAITVEESMLVHPNAFLRNLIKDIDPHTSDVNAAHTRKAALNEINRRLAIPFENEILTMRIKKYAKSF